MLRKWILWLLPDALFGRERESESLCTLDLHTCQVRFTVGQLSFFKRAQGKKQSSSLFESPTGKDEGGVCLPLASLHQPGRGDQQLSIWREGQSAEEWPQGVIMKNAHGQAFGCAGWSMAWDDLGYGVGAVLGGQVVDAAGPGKTAWRMQSAGYTCMHISAIYVYVCISAHGCCFQQVSPTISSKNLPPELNALSTEAACSKIYPQCCRFAELHLVFLCLFA